MNFEQLLIFVPLFFLFSFLSGMGGWFGLGGEGSRVDFPSVCWSKN